MIANNFRAINYEILIRGMKEKIKEGKSVFEEGDNFEKIVGVYCESNNFVTFLEI